MGLSGDLNAEVIKLERAPGDEEQAKVWVQVRDLKSILFWNM